MTVLLQSLKMLLLLIKLSETSVFDDPLSIKILNLFLIPNVPRQKISIELDFKMFSLIIPKCFALMFGGREQYERFSLLKRLSHLFSFFLVVVDSLIANSDPLVFSNNISIRVLDTSNNGKSLVNDKNYLGFQVHFGFDPQKHYNCCFDFLHVGFDSRKN